jgi:5-methylcytosine-specific restriction protein A
MCDNLGRIREATLLDHIVPIRDGGAILDPANLQPLCRWCHDIKTIEDLKRRGKVENKVEGDQLRFIG